MTILHLLIISPLIATIFTALIPKQHILLIKKVSLIFSLLIFALSLYFFIFFDINNSHYQWFSSWSYWNGIYYTIGIDGISLFFILLSTLLIFICLLVNWESVKFRVKEYTLLLFILEFFLLNVFVSLDLLFFYISFEAVLIPMFLIIGFWGSRERKIHAAFQFFIYTFIGSVFMLVAIYFIYLHVGSTNIEIVSTVTFSKNRELFLWLAFFIALGVKVPMFPVHLWLPEAHVEAPTSGSILLAGILLKLGTYGFLRFLLVLFPYGLIYYTPLVFTIALISIIYGSFATIRQIDLKKIIAYSSIVHMNFALLGLFTNDIEGIQGSLYIMLSHGIVSSALFLCIGILYDKYKTRLITYYGGLVNFMPLFSFFFLSFILSNLGFPGTSSFIGEILVLISVVSYNFKIAIFAASSMVLSAVYSLWLYNRIIFGELRLFGTTQKIKNINYFFYTYWFYKFADLTKREFMLLSLFFIFNILFGIYPSLILNCTYISALKLLI